MRESSESLQLFSAIGRVFQPSKSHLWPSKTCTIACRQERKSPKKPPPPPPTNLEKLGRKPNTSSLAGWRAVKVRLPVTEENFKLGGDGASHSYAVTWLWVNNMFPTLLALVRPIPTKICSKASGSRATGFSRLPCCCKLDASRGLCILQANHTQTCFFFGFFLKRELLRGQVPSDMDENDLQRALVLVAPRDRSSRCFL